MSTTIPQVNITFFQTSFKSKQEQNPIQTDDHNTNFMKAEKSASHEKHSVKQENLVSENSQKDHQEPSNIEFC